MTATPPPNAPLSVQKNHRAPFKLWMLLAAVTALLALTGMTGKQPVGQTLIPTPMPVIIGEATTATAAPSGADGVDETTGIILAGSFLVLIVLGGTLGATASRRKS